jgi:hypothetical protein
LPALRYDKHCDAGNSCQQHQDGYGYIRTIHEISLSDLRRNSQLGATSVRFSFIDFVFHFVEALADHRLPSVGAVGVAFAHVPFVAWAAARKVDTLAVSGFCLQQWKSLGCWSAAGSVISARSATT